MGVRPLRKGERTRQQAVARAAEIFSLRGYAGTSMVDLRRATGLKGGVYGHFASKEDLALEAFDYAVARLQGRATEALAGQEDAVGRLRAIVDVFRDLIEDPLLPGGCPILNTAVEADDAYPPLRNRARAAMDGWHARIEAIVADGVARGELRPETDLQAVATVLTATLEGAVMLSKLYDDPTHMHRAVDHLDAYLASLTNNE